MKMEGIGDVKESGESEHQRNSLSSCLPEAWTLVDCWSLQENLKCYGCLAADGGFERRCS